LIAVVDDEESARRALVRLLQASQVDVEEFASGHAFLSSLLVRGPIAWFSISKCRVSLAAMCSVSSPYPEFVFL
jgi:hypothetical protein